MSIRRPDAQLAKTMVWMSIRRPDALLAKTMVCMHFLSLLILVMAWCSSLNVHLVL